ncbi:hypothetical protein LX81_00289 [Palleronia aestuarii]|uniref:Uncharacterized protein n=1 Tax=Palleronia aestuarii TaxID=568105 RepID=A0A2W7P325_9RHOB|nr:hypothetical protein [Palleronia aestuarii]PZX19826.1 hypothetical protein LX81_00289 [Palleronia aestuarii]
MTDFVVYDETSGEELRSGTADTPEIANVQDAGDPGVAVLLATSQPGHYVDLSSPLIPTYAPRPTLPAIPATATAPWSYTPPAGATVTLTNEAGISGTFDDAEPITLTDTGVYRIRIDPPFPTMPVDAEITLA